MKKYHGKKSYIAITAKCSDLYHHDIYTRKGEHYRTYDGYVPSIIPNEYGDYLTLDIDPYTGVVLNWTFPFGKLKKGFKKTKKRGKK